VAGYRPVDKGGDVTDPTMSQESSPPPPVRDRKRDAKLVLSGVAAVLLIWFAIANLQDVPIHFWVTSTRSPLIVVVVISGFLGAMIVLLAQALRRRRGGRGGDDGYTGGGGTGYGSTGM